MHYLQASIQWTIWWGKTMHYFQATIHRTIWWFLRCRRFGACLSECTGTPNFLELYTTFHYLKCNLSPGHQSTINLPRPSKIASRDVWLRREEMPPTFLSPSAERELYLPATATAQPWDIEFSENTANIQQSHCIQLMCRIPLPSVYQYWWSNN